MTPEVQLNTVIPDSFKIAQIFQNQHSLKSNAAKGIFAGYTLQEEQAPSSLKPEKYPLSITEAPQPPEEEEEEEKDNPPVQPFFLTDGPHQSPSAS